MRGHAAIRDPEDIRYCRVCGEDVEGWANEVRHVGEIRRPTVVARPYQRAFERAIAAARSEIRSARPDLPAEQVDALARVTAEAMYRAGLLRIRPGDRHGLASDGPAEPDLTATRYDLDRAVA